MTLDLRGHELAGRPDLNKDAAFTREERECCRLRGLLPYRVATIEQQVALELEHLRRKTDNLERYIGLAALQDRNETLFHRLLLDHLEELAPVVYTPTVGDACRQFSHILRRPRGLWVTPDDMGNMPALLRNVDRPHIRLVVATDNERILGLGDLGAGGMGIPIGKLALYTAGAGVPPSQTLPVSLDCGTDNEGLLRDPLYLGYPHPRLRGSAYDAFVEEFVAAITAHYPGVVLQWEDFKQHNAIRLLERYRHRIASFNDDIQGTAAVVLAGLLAALRLRGESLSRQRLLLVGAGAAGLGIAALAQAQMREEHAGETSRAIVMVDSHGLVFAGREQIDTDKVPFALSQVEMSHYGFAPADRYDVETVIRTVAPTILIGTTGTAGTFSETMIRQMSARVAAPIVMPLSNPNANAEATPAEILAWSGGRAVVATGSPFDPVTVAGRPRLVGQANNVFIFPGVGLGAIVARAREVTDRMFLVAARTLATRIATSRLRDGAIYPAMGELRSISRAIAVAVAQEAQRSGFAQLPDDADIESLVDIAMWSPEYQTVTANWIRGTGETCDFSDIDD
jgi:malate dehydrogenase (oxaloacetate-decarboxylating)